jgi:hypothetical protein
MEDNTNSMESLFEKATDYGKTSYELAKLKAVDKASDVISEVIPRTFIVAIILFFMTFLNLGIAFWIGEILGEIFYGFFAIAGFYCIVGIVLHFFMHNWIKSKLQNCFIKQVLK